MGPRSFIRGNIIYGNGLDRGGQSFNGATEFYPWK